MAANEGRTENATADK